MLANQEQLSKSPLQAVSPQQGDTLLIGLVGQNSMELTEKGVSDKGLGGTSHMQHLSTTPHLQRNDKTEEALRCSPPPRFNNCAGVNRVAAARRGARAMRSKKENTCNAHHKVTFGVPRVGELAFVGCPGEAHSGLDCPPPIRTRNNP